MTTLTPTQKATLRFLRHRGPCRISVICAHFRVEYTTGRKRAEELVTLGLAEKLIDGQRVVYQIKETP